MAAILIIEDDVHINNLLREALEQEGYQCIQAFSGSEGNLVLEKGGFDLVLLDLMLPGMPGEKVLLEIRQKGQIPVIVLTAKEELDSKVDMLLAGADDYILKPFEIREVLARIQVQLRKSGNVGQKTVLEHKGLRLDKEEHQISVNGTILTGITRQEFQILELFLTWPKKVFGKEEIFEAAWQEPFMGETKAIDVHISNIRKKLRAVSDVNYIETVWGIGYKLTK
ncbi:response regulator transcription factor [Sellimonas sp.]|uniref:response regulator transcription factor n=1 Tax=Sellimonas sp. TaxID=2021466 RepID=UPI000B3AB7E8|nr:response regulator transcription factor [Sellimonas sp.]OUP03328.1 DNA-binding response regulator [Drancourtella sp. An210]